MPTVLKVTCLVATRRMLDKECEYLQGGHTNMAASPEGDTGKNGVRTGVEGTPIWLRFQQGTGKRETR